jgi:Cu(I)/Ag(I) efflux system membrane protein CusA/SilA
MSRIAAPMVGGMLSAPLLSLFVIPAAFKLMRRRGLAPAARYPASQGGAGAP